VSRRPTPGEPAHGAAPQADAGTHGPAAAPADDEVFQVTPGAHEPLADLAREAGARLHDSSHARRRWAAWMMLAVAIVGGAIGTSALAASAGFTRPGPVAVMAAGYLVCFIALTRALRVIPISVAYAVWSGVGITLVSGIGWLWLGQALNRGEMIGIALILVGTVVIQLFSRSQDDASR
jgi:small multidrug resistance pump